MIKHFFIASLLLVTNVFALDLTLKPVEVIVPFPPGGGVDATYRHFEQYAKTKGVTTVPVYKPGAEGLIAMKELSTGSKDGYRIAFSTTALHTNAIQKDNTLDIVPLTTIKNPLGVMVVHASSDITNVDQLAVRIKTDDKFNIATGGPGQTMVWVQFFEQIKSPQKVLIKYKGGQPVINDLLGKHIDAALLPMVVVSQHIKNGTLRAIAHTGSDVFADYPTVTPLATKYPSWKQLDMFIAVTPVMDTAANAAWTSLLKQYVNDNAVQKHFRTEHSEPVPFGSTIVNESVKNINNIRTVHQSHFN